MPRIRKSCILFLFLVAVSCSSDKNGGGRPLAKVGDRILYYSEVRNMLPDEISASDSTLMVEDYIKKWVQKELVIQKAEENLSAEQKDVTKELEEYRKSLILYKYEKEMVRQKMDTLVTQASIREYYVKNLETFVLTRNVVRAVFMKIPVKKANPAQIKLLCQDESDENFRDLREYCMLNAKSYDLFNSAWVDFDLVLSNMPGKIEDQESFLAKNKILEKQDYDYYYLVYIYDYFLKGQQAPVDYYSSQIKSLILNKRKISFLKKIEEDIYNEGIRNKKFELYDVE